MSTPRYLYLTTLPNQDTELVHAECHALTGHTPNSYGIALSGRCVDVRRGAYVKSCMEVLFEAESVSAICAQIQSTELCAKDFRVSVVRLPRDLKVDTMQMAHTVGGVIAGNACLTHPKVVFLLVVTDERMWLGRVLSESDGMWVSHQKRPHITSSSLPTRLARAVVNLLASPGDRLIDPCCGTGTIVLEAAHIGVKAVGYDINPKMVRATQANLAHYGLNAHINLGDAREVSGRFDAVATDLPYGIMLPRDESQDSHILQNARHLAPKAAFIALRDLSVQLVDVGYCIKQTIHVPKQRIVRRIFVTTSDAYAE